MMYVLLAVVAFSFLNSDKFQSGFRGAVACRKELAVKAVNDVLAGDEFAPVRQEVIQYITTGRVTDEIQTMLAKTAAIKAQEEAEREKLKYVFGEETIEGSFLKTVGGKVRHRPVSA